VQASPASSPLHRSAQSSGQLAIARSNANQINPFERGNPYKFRHESNTALADLFQFLLRIEPFGFE
jgi:hypothetical protein